MNMVERAEAWVVETLAVAGQGEDIDHAVSVQLMPTPQGLITGLVVCLSLPGGLVGTREIGSCMMPHPSPPQEQVAQSVQDLVEQLRTQRSATLSQSNGHQAQGLIVPPGS